MSDLSLPPQALVPTKSAAPWHWPTPPFAGYASAADAQRPACEIEGLTSAAIAAELLALDFEAGWARIRIKGSPRSRPTTGDPHAPFNSNG